MGCAEWMGWADDGPELEDGLSWEDGLWLS